MSTQNFQQYFAEAKPASSRNNIQPIRTSVVTNIKHSEDYFQSRALMTEISRVSPCSSYLGAPPQSRNKLNILSTGTGRIMTETLMFDSRLQSENAAKKITHLKKASMLQGESNSFDIGDCVGSPSSSSVEDEKFQNISAMDDLGFSDSLIQMVSERKTNQEQNSITKKVERQFSSRINFTNINQVKETSPLSLGFNSI